MKAELTFPPEFVKEISSEVAEMLKPIISWAQNGHIVVAEQGISRLYEGSEDI